MDKYKFKERIFRLKELVLLDQEIGNFGSIKERIVSFFISYRMPGASDDQSSLDASKN